MDTLHLRPLRLSHRQPVAATAITLSSSCSAGKGPPQPQRISRSPSSSRQWWQPAQRSAKLSVVAESAMLDAASAARLPAPIAPHHQQEAVLCQRFRAHSSALTSLLILTDTDDKTEIVTASLDKSVALWSSTCSSELPMPEICGHSCLGEVEGALRVAMPGAPIFSMALDSEMSGSGRRQVLLGTSAKSVLAWEPPQMQTVENVSLSGHTGWVRALAVDGKWLFSCSCNKVRAWDMSRAVPRLVNEECSFTGDIIAATVGAGQLFTGGACGAIRLWKIDSKSGRLKYVMANQEAHTGRVTGVAWSRGFLYTSSSDGTVRMWDASLELVTSVPDAHDGGKVNCLAIGPDGVIYTGGDDKLVRRWRAGISPKGLLAEAAPPLYCHNAPVRAIAAGPRHSIVSGDKRGDVAVWRI